MPIRKTCTTFAFFAVFYTYTIPRANRARVYIYVIDVGFFFFSTDIFTRADTGDRRVNILRSDANVNINLDRYNARIGDFSLTKRTRARRVR